MNKKILFILLLSWIVVGCGSQPPADGQPDTWANAGCTVQDEERCDDKDMNAPKLELNLDTWTLEPECVKAKKGGDITISLKSSKTIEEGSVMIFPEKVENYYWLAKSNSPNKNEIKIKVKKKNPSGGDLLPKTYRYGIYTGDKCMDPRVDVKN